MHLLKRRPSASMIVALVALFAALGGVGYAAVSMPRNSVGTTQLQDGSVTNHKLAANAVGYQKIKPNSVGVKRVNPNQVQLRVGGNCTAGAITAIDAKGKVTCASAPAAEFDTSTKEATALTPVDSAGSAKPTVVTLNSEPLPGGSSYIGFATPFVEVTAPTGSNATQHVEVDCTMALGPATTATVTRSATVNVNANNGPAFISVPLTATAPSSTSATTGTVACSSTYTNGTAAPTVKVQSTLNVLQTASNTTTTPAS